MAQTVSRRFDTHSQARLGAFETKMAALKGRWSIAAILPKNRAMWIVQKVKELCVRLVVYCHRQPEQPANKFVLREPKHDRQNSGRPAKSLLSVLMEDALLQSREELASLLTAWSKSVTRQAQGLS